MTLSPGLAHILSHSRGEKLGEGLGSKILSHSRGEKSGEGLGSRDKIWEGPGNEASKSTHLEVSKAVSAHASVKSVILCNFWVQD